MTLPSPGEVFDGRYQIVRELGRGGFATVFLATNTTTNAQVALKVLTPDAGGRYDADQRRRFLREARVLARVEHPHIAKLLHFGEAGALFYIATEYVDGTDLSELLNRRGRLSSDEAKVLLTQLLSALAAAHRAGLIHRDIKPENVRVIETAEGPFAKLLDFGIARATDQGAPSLTKTGELIGTPRYMAPEQLREQATAPASDIYSLGVLGFELVLGRGALHGGAWSDQLERLRTGHLIAPGASAAIDPELRQVLRRMTAVSLEDRLASASAVIAALQGRSGIEISEPARRHVGLIAVAVLLGIGIIALGVSVMLSDEERVRIVPDRNAQRVRAAALTTEREPTSSPTEAEVRSPDVGGAPEFSEFASPGCELGQPDYRVFAERDFAYVPPACANRDCPLLVALHGNSLQPKTFVREGLRELARKHEFVVVAPFGGVFRGLKGLGHVEDSWEKSVKANRAIVGGVYAHSLDALCFDTSRVFVLGYSDGAEAAVDLTCESWVTAAMGFGVSLRPPDKPGGTAVCKTPRAPFLWLHPTDSKRAPVETGPTCTSDKKLGYEDTTSVFVDTHACTSSVRISLGPGSDCERWDCDVPLTTCKVKGGRLWPGLAIPLLDGFNHGCSESKHSEVDVGEIMWSSFESATPLEDPPTVEEIMTP